MEDSGSPGDAFEFTGTWREYLPIALSNLALTIVTLGIYRFWAKARERRYLWSRTRFIDDRLEWTGTGKEMFVGFLIVSAVVLVPLFVINTVAQGMILRGQVMAGGLLIFALYIGALMLFGLARFRALRYRLSRTWWHGIRGGSDLKGGHYAVSSLWKTAVGAFAIGLLIPWSMISLWNERWNAMSFGPYRFGSSATTEGLIGRWIGVMLGSLVVAVFVGVAAMALGTSLLPLFMLIGYAGWLFIGIAFYAAYLRKAIGGLELGPLGLTFEAGAGELALLFLGDIALVIGTLGFGLMFVGYRHWSFFVRHLGATGTIDLAALTQSTTAAPREAEGFADAFDIGAL